MLRRIAVTVVAFLLWGADDARSQDWRAGVDPRVELMSVLFRLAGNREYSQSRVSAYDKAIEGYFAPYRDHEAVGLARLLGTGFDGPMKLAVNVRDADSLAERVPFDRLSVHLYQGWDAGKARDFLGAARRFATDSKFQDFLQSQQPLYTATSGRLQAFVAEKCDLGWFARFFGSAPPARFIIVPGLANGSASYAARVVDETGVQEIYAIPGVSKVDPAGLPVFDADWRTTLVHEVAHAFTDPVAGKFAAGMRKAAGQIYAPVSAAMKRQSYGSARILLNESLARAATIEYVMEHDGQEAAQRVIRQENSRSFFWMSGLVELLDAYRSDRRQYPTFDSFMPRVVEYFNGVAPRIQELTERMQPKVISTSIPEGARDVDSGVKSIVVRFSLPMSRTGPNRSSKVSGGRFDGSGTVVTIPVNLEPERDYVIPLRWAGGQSFVSADGVPLPVTLLRFRTGAAPAPKPQ